MTIQNNVITEDNVARAHDLVSCMEKGDEQGAREIIDEMTRIRESILYTEMGKLTRELHDAISAFGMDDRIASIAEHEIPDARQRLNFVIEKTAEAADTTLTAIEQIVPDLEKVQQQAEHIHREWQRFKQREMNADEFRQLSKTITDFLQVSSANASASLTSLNNVLLAQGFQDITGQIITRVIRLVEDVEKNLVNLIRLTSVPQISRDKGSYLQGPVVPGTEHENTVSGQDEVDELLSSLGF